MPHRSNGPVQAILAAVAVAFGFLTAHLPLPVCRMLGKWLGRVAYYLVPRIRRVAHANLRLAYGDGLASRARRRIARGAAENLGIVAAEFAHIDRITPEFVSQHLTMVGTEHLDLTRGALILGAHFGNWEWMAPIVRTFHPKTAEVVRPMDNGLLDAFVDRVRRSNGVRTVQKRGAGAEVVRLLREGYVVGVLVDQSPREGAVPVMFFDRLCWATAAPVAAAMRARAPVHVMSLTRDIEGRYHMEISSPMQWPMPEDLWAALPEYVQQIQGTIETMVRARPEQWLWLHQRWKSRPRLEEEWARREHAAGESQTLDDL